MPVHCQFLYSSYLCLVSSFPLHTCSLSVPLLFIPLHCQFLFIPVHYQFHTLHTCSLLLLWRWLVHLSSMFGRPLLFLLAFNSLCTCIVLHTVGYSAPLRYEKISHTTGSPTPPNHIRLRLGEIAVPPTSVKRSDAREQAHVRITLGNTRSALKGLVPKFRHNCMKRKDDVIHKCLKIWKKEQHFWKVCKENSATKKAGL